MPLPLILGIGAAISGIAGVGTGIYGAAKVKEAADTKQSIELVKYRYDQNYEKCEKQNEATNKTMDTLGELELNILKSFEEFSDVIEKIQNRPEFKPYNKNNVKIPQYHKETLKEVSIGAGVLLGGLGGAALGTAGGFAAAGATTSAVMALGTASTGTAIASLSGAALTNATLAALGGGALAAGGGGMALGTTILGATTLGVGLLVGGIIFSVAGSKISEKADEAYEEISKAEGKINKIYNYLKELNAVAVNYTDSLKIVREKYLEQFHYLSYIVNVLHKVDWEQFSNEEKLVTENTVLLVGLLYKMCQVKLVLKSDDKNDINTVNKGEVYSMIKNSKQVLEKVA